MTTYDEFEASSVEHRRMLRQEELILEVTEALVAALNDASITRADLARRLGKTPGFVSQVLNGERNFTLRTVADIADALDCRVHANVVPASASPARRSCDLDFGLPCEGESP